MCKRKFNKTFQSFLISYVLILLIPLFAGFISYHTSIKIAESKSIESSLLMLNQSKSHLERRLAEVEKFSRQLTRDGNIRSILNNGKVIETNNAYQHWRISKELFNYVQSNDFLQDSYIYLKQDDVIIKPGSVFVRSRHFYELYQYQDISFSDWKIFVLEDVHQREIHPLEAYKVDERETSIITYLQSIPLNSFDQSQGAIVIPIEQNKISDLFKGISKQYGGWAFIADQKGNPLTFVGTDEEAIKEFDLGSEMDKQGSSYIDAETLLIYTQSDNGWIYYAGIPKERLMEEANIIKKMTWIVTISTLFIGLIISLILAYRKSRPILTLMGILGEQTKGDNLKYGNEYDFLKGNISTLISNNKSLQKNLNEQLPMLRDAFITRLISGDFNSINDVKLAASQVSIKLHENAGYVGIIHVKGYGDMESEEIYDELNAARVIIKQTLININPNLLVCYQGSDKVIVIFPFNKNQLTSDTNKIEQTMDKLMVIIKTYRISINTFIGNLFKDYTEINLSYNEAVQTMDYAELMNVEGILKFGDIEKKGEMYYYPIEIEIRLSNALGNGEFGEAKQTIHEIFKWNFEARDLPIDMGYLLIAELKSTLIKILEPKVIRDQETIENLKSKILQVQLTDSYEKVEEDIIHIVKYYCDFIEKWKIETEDVIINQIEHFLGENYHDSGLSLYIIAENLGRPESYVSRFFKEKTGEHIMGYLEDLRIKKASELLINTDKTIKEIAYKVGYNSPHSFRRAFKRVMNMTPNVYRKTVR